MKIACIVALIFSLMAGSALAQRDSGQSGSATPSSTAVVLLGSVTTSVARKKSDFWFVVGWGLIVTGSVSSASRTVRRVLFGDATELQIFSGKNRPEELQAKIANGDLLQKIEMDSLFAMSNPNLISALPMGDVLTQAQLDPTSVGQLITQAKVLGDKALRGKEFGTEITSIPIAALLRTFGPLTREEKHILTNYLRLRNIEVIR
jgi:hypothetical protein